MPNCPQKQEKRMIPAFGYILGPFKAPYQATQTPRFIFVYRFLVESVGYLNSAWGPCFAFPFPLECLPQHPYPYGPYPYP